jgi:hypothetical protein
MDKLWSVLPACDLRIAGRAVNHGRAPLDSNVRRAAALLATYQLNQSSRIRWPELVLFGFLTLVSAIIALTDSPWWWIAAAGYATLDAPCRMYPRHLRRRVEILGQEP